MNNDMKRRLTDATLEAIARNNGVRGLSLRRVAEKAGRTHVNVYHYADGLAGLLWWAYAEALDAFAAACLAGTEASARAEPYGPALARAMVDFALEREGLYRLLWSEDLGGAPEGEALAAISRARAGFERSAFDAFRAEGLDGDAATLSGRQSALFAYLQGELAMLINGRSGPDKWSAGAMVVERAGMVWRLLLSEPA